MKKKFVIFTLCFTLIFSSFNYKKSYADMGVISAPMVGTVVALASATGLLLNNSDDIYYLASKFYDTYKDNWEETKEVFNTCVSIGLNGAVTVGKEFKDKVVSFLNNYYSTSTSSPNVGVLSSQDNGNLVFKFNSFDSYNFPSGFVTSTNYTSLGQVVTVVDTSSNKTYYGTLIAKCGTFYNRTWNELSKTVGLCVGDLDITETLNYYAWSEFPNVKFIPYDDYYKVGFSGSSIDRYRFYFDGVLPSIGGVYNPSNVGNDDVDIYVPGNLGDLVGSNDGVLGNPSYDLPSNGVVSVPGVENPSISIDTSIPFPGVDLDVPGAGNPSVPNDGIWATIKDFIISLVVPSDTFWTDTWGGLYNNFTNSFPMVDMDGFNDLVTGEKKFPNIDINIMGITGRVVNGDVINSIVDWLRPIIAGFMMICLMLFNYRKIYKLIRNTEPFGGIAPGTSDFKTGISEYTHVGLVNDGFKRSEEEEFARSRYYEEMHFRNGGKL